MCQYWSGGQWGMWCPSQSGGGCNVKALSIIVSRESGRSGSKSGERGVLQYLYYSPDRISTSYCWDSGRAGGGHVAGWLHLFKDFLSQHLNISPAPPPFTLPSPANHRESKSFLTEIFSKSIFARPLLSPPLIAQQSSCSLLFHAIIWAS